jgi:hypothetical protein
MDNAIELIDEVLQSAIDHPAFLGFITDGVTDEEVDEEGGDSAFVTKDIAWKLQIALEILKGKK